MRHPLFTTSRNDLIAGSAPLSDGQHANCGPIQAERYLESLNAKIEMAAEHPDFGADYGFVVEGVRRYESVSHAIYYRPTQSGILVLRVLHGRMDPARHLG